MRKTQLIILLIIGFFFFTVTTTAEEVTLTTYYPAPYGEYQQLICGSAVFTKEYDNGSQSGSFTIDWNNGNKQKLTLVGNVTLTFTAPTAQTGNAANFVLRLIQDGIGSRTVSWGSGKWPGGTVPTLTTTPGAIDIVCCYYDGTDYYCLASLDFK